MLYFSIGNGTSQGTGTVPIVSAHFRSLWLDAYAYVYEQLEYGTHTFQEK